MSVVQSEAPRLEERAKEAKPPAPRTTQVPNARPELVRFAFLALQLALMLFVIRGLKLHQGYSVSLPFALCVWSVVAFVIHYWLPYAFKKPAFVILSLMGVFAALGPQDWLAFNTQAFWQQFGEAAKFLGAVLLVGGTFFGILRLPISFWLRIGIIIAIACGLAYGRAQATPLWLTGRQWAVLGGIFMFRMILYAKEVKVAKKPETLQDFLCYFFLLPNLFFPLFPVIDYTTFKRGYYAKNIHTSAQKGIFWMVRGLLQICLFRWLYQNEIVKDEVQNVGILVLFLFQFYLQYVQVSGLFHFIVGMLHLFGWELPETNRKYFLASSFTDFWRRINIYWKDFMIKAFYYPAYFRLRKYGDMVALSVATIIVFIATTVLHGYQNLWILGHFSITAQDCAFWGALGVIVMITVLYETKRGKPKPRPKIQAFGLRVVQTLGVFVTISLLWSLWSMTPAQWWDVVTYAFQKSFS